MSRRFSTVPIHRRINSCWARNAWQSRCYSDRPMRVFWDGLLPPPGRTCPTGSTSSWTRGSLCQAWTHRAIRCAADLRDPWEPQHEGPAAAFTFLGLLLDTERRAVQLHARRQGASRTVDPHPDATPASGRQSRRAGTLGFYSRAMHTQRADIHSPPLRLAASGLSQRRTIPAPMHVTADLGWLLRTLPLSSGSAVVMRPSTAHEYHIMHASPRTRRIPRGGATLQLRGASHSMAHSALQHPWRLRPPRRHA